MSELQADRVSRIAAGTDTATPFAHLLFPGDVEWTPDGLVVTHRRAQRHRRASPTTLRRAGW